MRELVHVFLSSICKQEPNCKSYNNFAKIRNVFMNLLVRVCAWMCYRSYVRLCFFFMCVGVCVCVLNYYQMIAEEKVLVIQRTISRHFMASNYN